VRRGRNDSESTWEQTRKGNIWTLRTKQDYVQRRLLGVCNILGRGGILREESKRNKKV